MNNQLGSQLCFQENVRNFKSINVVSSIKTKALICTLIFSAVIVRSISDLLLNTLDNKLQSSNPGTA